MKPCKPKDLRKGIVYKNADGFWRYDGLSEESAFALYKFTKVIFDDNSNEIEMNSLAVADLDALCLE